MKQQSQKALKRILISLLILVMIIQMKNAKQETLVILEIVIGLEGVVRRVELSQLLSMAGERLL